MKISEVKQKAIDALGTIDLSKLTLPEIGTFVTALNTLSMIRESDEQSDTWKEIYDKLYTSFEQSKTKTVEELK